MGDSRELSIYKVWRFTFFFSLLLLILRNSHPIREGRGIKCFWCNRIFWMKIDGNWSAYNEWIELTMMIKNDPKRHNVWKKEMSIWEENIQKVKMKWFFVLFLSVLMPCVTNNRKTKKKKISNKWLRG